MLRSSLLFTGELGSGDFLIYGAAPHQLVVCADADGAPFIQYDYFVSVPYGADALSYNQAGGIL